MRGATGVAHAPRQYAQKSTACATSHPEGLDAGRRRRVALAQGPLFLPPARVAALVSLHCGVSGVADVPRAARCARCVSVIAEMALDVGAPRVLPCTGGAGETAPRAPTSRRVDSPGTCSLGMRARPAPPALRGFSHRGPWRFPAPPCRSRAVGLPATAPARVAARLGHDLGFERCRR